MRHNLLGTLAVILLLFSACQKEESLPSNKKLLSFTILESNNKGKISGDVHAAINNDVITLSLSKYDDIKSLVAIFEYDGSKVQANGVEQKSGVTANDYSQPLTFTVEAQDGTKSAYTVKVTLEEPKALSAFHFLKSKNPDLLQDVSCIIAEEGGAVTSPATFTISKLIPVFSTNAVKVLVNDVEQVSGVTENDFSSPVTYQCVMRNGEVFTYIVTLKFGMPPKAIPQLTITTDEPVNEITSKDDYLTGTLTVDGKGVFEDYTGKTEIKGRGNSTWGYPKKPYRLKLDKKSKICGLGVAKNYVLLANYIDPTLMLNSVAFEIGHLLEIPFTNHAIPVDVTLNGIYKGSYLLTEQVEIYESRVNIDPKKGIIWEMDSYFDEDLKFKSTPFDLPVMVKDLDDETLFESWKNDLNAFLTQFNKPLEGNNYVDMIDIESVANYLIVFNLTNNMEINHPKSVYMHKEGTGKYVMGPIWDFDWAYGYEGTGDHFGSYTKPLFSSQIGGGIGTAFFQRFLSDSRVKAIYKTNWTNFRAGKFQELLQYIDDYALMLKPSVTRENSLWNKANLFDIKVKKLKTWLEGRAGYIDQEVAKY